MTASPRARFGRYDLLLELGRGGMAALWLGRRSGAGGFEQLVAIKRVLPGRAELRPLFLNEARIAARLSHPNVCIVHELDEVDGEPYLAMEYLRGVTWDHLIAAVPPGELALRATAAVTMQACAALHYAHTLRDATGAATPVVHRDVSPQNLFVTVDGVVKVLDFGIAKMDGGPRTRTGTVKGKQPYMAPEQLRGGAIDGRADGFALGACAWEALTGTRLYDRPTDFAIWKAICDEPVPTVGGSSGDAIDAVLGRALAKDAAQRYPTAAAFAAAFGDATTPLTDEELAALVRTRCADRLARREREVAAVVTESRAASRAMRAATDADADATIASRPAALRPAQASVPTVSVSRRGASLVMPRRQPSTRMMAAALIGAVLLVGAAVVIVLVVTRGGASATRRAAPPAEREPAAKPTISIDRDGITVESNGMTIDLRPPQGDREPEAEKGE